MRTNNIKIDNLQKQKAHKKYNNKPIIQKNSKKPVDLNNSGFLRQFLSPKYSKIEQLSHTQRKIIQKQFDKMILGIKKNIKVKNKNNQSESSYDKLCTKTKKFHFFEEEENSKTVRKKNFTERKHKINQHSQLSERIKLQSPNKSFKISVNQETKKLELKSISSPNKNKKSLKKQKVFSTTKDSSRKKILSTPKEDNFFLMGDSFVAFDDESVSRLKQEMLKQSGTQLIVSNLNQQNEKIKEQFYSPAAGSQSNIKIESKSEIEDENDQCKLFSLSKNSKMTKIDKQEEEQQIFKSIFSNYEDVSEIQGSSFEYQQKNSVTPEKKQARVLNQIIQLNEQKNLMDVRIKAINVRMKTSTQFLESLFKSHKITKEEYSQYLDSVMIKYDQELTEAEHLKALISQNQQKIQKIVSETENIIKCTEQIQKFGQNNQSEQIKKQLTNIFGNLSSSSISDTSPQKQKNILLFGQPQKIINTDLQPTKNDHAFIQDRIANQIGLKKTLMKPIVNTSVLGIFQFLKNFYLFLNSHHSQQLLRYINMPYGYSIEQRLIYMQGYDSELDETSENQMGIVYGIQEILSPEIYENFYKNLESQRDQSRLKYEKIHNKAIFDGINEALNEYRPYYFLNGPPYPWTFSEKTLTFFYVSEENIGQVLEKVQFQILKWASCLCGLIVPELIKEQLFNRNDSEELLPINQIFQSYTQSVSQSLIQERQQKTIKAQKLEIQTKNYEWFHQQEQKTAILLEISSLILQQLSNQPAILMFQKKFKIGLGFSLTSLI